MSSRSSFLCSSLIVALASAVSAADNPAKDNPAYDAEVRFVVLGDSQFANMGMYERMMHEVNMLRPDFVTQVGDMIQGYHHNEEKAREEWRIYKAQIEPLTMPFYPVPGNHDVVTPETHKVYGEVWGEDSYVYSWDYGPVHVVSLDSYWPDESERIAAWQRDWLAQDLDEWARRMEGAGRDPAEGAVFVLLHAPLWRYGDNTAGRQDWTQVHEILRQYPTKLVVGGHTHEYVWEEHDGIQYIVLNSSGSMGGDVERGGFFRGYLHVSVEDGEWSPAVIRAGSILPLDTINNEERRNVPELAFRGGTIRMPEWQAGAAIEKTISIPLSNSLEEPRLFHLEWEIPRGADVTIEPADLWVEVPAGETLDQDFLLMTANAPGAGSLPRLRVSSTRELRSGVVSREWEARYRQRMAAAETDPSIITTNIALEAPVEFTSTWTLYIPPVHEAVPRTGTVTLDGKLDESDWMQAPVLSSFRGGAYGTPDVETHVRFLYDDEFLYVAARMEEPNPELLTNKAAGADIPLTWGDDDIEFFFDPQQTQRDYFRLFQNSFGTRFNSLPRDVEDKYYDSRYESAIHVGEDEWVLEAAIPWDEAGAEEAPRPGDEWSFTVGRHRQQSDPPRMQWTSLYNPREYGVLRFTRSLD